MPHILLSSHRHVRNAELVASSVSRIYAGVEYGVDIDDPEAYVVQILYKPDQILIWECLDTRFVLRLAKDGGDLIGESRRRSFKTMKLL
jgi:hypothetical protein